MNLHELFTLLNLPIETLGHDMTQLHYKYFLIETLGYNTYDIKLNAFLIYKYVNKKYLGALDKLTN